MGEKPSRSRSRPGDATGLAVVLVLLQLLIAVGLPGHYFGLSPFPVGSRERPCCIGHTCQSFDLASATRECCCTRARGIAASDLPGGPSSRVREPSPGGHDHVVWVRPQTASGSHPAPGDFPRCVDRRPRVPGPWGLAGSRASGHLWRTGDSWEKPAGTLWTRSLPTLPPRAASLWGPSDPVGSPVRRPEVPVPVPISGARPVYS